MSPESPHHPTQENTMNTRTDTPAIAIGQPYAGGIKLGNFFLGEDPYTLITPTKAELAAVLAKRAR
jgi:hypothetical protein